MHQRSEVKLGGPAGPFRSRPRERHTIDRHGPVSNGQASAPIHPIASQQLSNQQTQKQTPHRTAPQPAPAHHANLFAPLAESAADSEPAAGDAAPSPAPLTHTIRFSRVKPRIHTYTQTQPLDTRSATSAPKRGCMRVVPVVADAATVTSFTGIHKDAFRSLLPQGRPRAMPFAPANYHVFTNSHASAGPHGGVLFRVNATVHGHPARCLIDCGASSDFISTDFVRRHGLEKHMLTTKHRVRGYDGQLTPAAGVLAAPVALTALDAVKDAAPLQLLAAQLHSDDVILGLPWLTVTGAVIDFAARSVALDHAGTRLTISLAQASRPERAAGTAPTTSSQLMEAVVALYSAEVNDDRVGPADLAALLRDNGAMAAMLRDTDDRGSMRPIEAHKPYSAVSAEPGLDAVRKKLLTEFVDVFPEKLPPGLPPSRGHELHIELRPGTRPPHRQPLRQNQKHAVFEAKWIKDMLANGHIKSSQSEYAAPHFYVPKPDSATTGEYRAVTDYRLLNAQTVKNRYPLPRADQLFDKLAHAKYFSKIDLRTGFYQILIAEKDRHKTAFSTSQGLFEYNVLPMGLCNSPGVFMALMNDTFREYLDQFVLVFLDDIIVYSDTLEDHERHLRLALQRLREQRLCAKLSKSALCQTEVEFLGHYVGRDGLRVMEDKVDAVRDWPVPTTIRELRAFLGLAGYYRRFVKGFSEIALPLTELTRHVTHQRLQWSARQQLAFVQLKRALQSTPVLALPDPALPFVVNCDASGYAVGAVLQQDRGSGLQPIAFMSKKLTGAESRYPVHEQELLAIITALTTWRHYLSGTSVPVCVRTDHKSLIHFQTQPMLSGRQTRWLETLSEYDYAIEYIKGENNEVADALSRRGDLNDGTADRPPAFVDTKRTFALNHIMTRTERTALIDEINAIERAQRHAPRRQPDRQAELRRQEARAKAVDAARRVIPEQEVPADRPRPKAGGMVVMPTQRCTADNKLHAQCGCKTAKGQHCHVHMRSMDGLRVTKSTVAGAGSGLFATRDFAEGDHLADYTGDELIIRQGSDGGPYCLALTQRRAIDAAPTNTGYGRWANDPRGSNGGPNAEFVLNPARGTGRLRATARIRKGDEIFVSYGRMYWATFGRDAKVVARPARPLHRAAAREVIDLTAMGSTTFSSELAAEFDAACAADADYAARLARGDRMPTDNDKTDLDELVTRDGRLFTRSSGALYVPKGDALRTRLIRECHDSATAGHLGRDKTVEQMQRRFFWHGMTTRVGEYVTTCDACQRNKPSQRLTPGLLMPIASPTRAGHTWTMDLITGLPKSRGGNDAIVVWVCKFSKLRHYAACKTAISAPQLARLFLSTVVRHHGMPERIISDRDPRFTAHFWRAFWSSLGSTLDMGAAYHPESDGQTENANKTLEIMLRSVIDFTQDDWDDHLPAAELAFNNSKNATTGFTPFYLVYGREARMPIDIALAPLTKAADNPAAAEATARWRAALQHASENTTQQQRRQKTYADRVRRDVRFAVGDRVLLSTEHLKLIGERRRTRKLTERFIGPYRVKRVVNANAYELELPASLKIHPVINIGHLKEYHDGVRAFPDRPVRLTRPEPEALDDNGAPEWLVDRLLDHRKVKRGTRHIDQYLVEWKGYPISEATWEPIENLTGSMDLVQDFNDQRHVQLSTVVTQVARPGSPNRAA